MARRIICIIFLITGSCTLASAKKLSVSGSLELYSAYMWRGSRECGPNVSPTLSLSLGNFTLQSYGTIAFDGSYKEVDWDLSYKVKAFTFHLADYYFYSPSYGFPENYFQFKKDKTTTHIQEAIICYEPEKLPFALRWFTFLHGNWIPEDDGSLGRPSFSSYLEAEVYHDFSPQSRLSLLGGASVFKGMFTSYTKNFAVINVMLKYSYTFDLGPVSMPLNLSYIINPYAKTSWLNAGIGVAF